MGISNSIGSNTFDILLCLGLPWFIKAAFMPTIPNRHWVIFYFCFSCLCSYTQPFYQSNRRNAAKENFADFLFPC